MLSPVKAVVFVLVHQGLFGLYLGCSFAPNHKGMPILTANDDSDFLRRQVLTSRNVRGGWLTDLALGGLNYQIEHHLFPSMPRPNLRHAQADRARLLPGAWPVLCQTSLLDSYRQALRHLNAVGRLTHPGRGDLTLSPVADPRPRKPSSQKTGKAAGMLGVAGFTGCMTLLFAAIALWWLRQSMTMDQGWAALIVAAIWAAIGVVL